MSLDQAIDSNRFASSSQPRKARAALSQRARHVGAHIDLTTREREVLGLAGQGLSNKGIAQTLGISSGTVTWHLKNCYQKYGVNTREQALGRARLHAQIKPIVTSICTCGRVHTLWEPVSADGSWKEAKHK